MVDALFQALDEECKKETELKWTPNSLLLLCYLIILINN
jgi:hypothetical protein